jgi:uncharacterized protein (UPF0548 family)
MSTAPVVRITRPTRDDVVAHLDAQRPLALTYSSEGATRTEAAPDGYEVDHNRTTLGRGEATFWRARDAVRRWAMFPAPLAWIEPLPIAIEPGELAGVIVRAFGLWWLNAARIVYVIDEPRRFGFAYGTLPGHAEQGEERFSVEWLDDDSVWYDLYAFSRPRHWAARAGKPVVRLLQRRFARMSLAAMKAAT